MVVQVCIGSSCHIKGSHDIIELLQKRIETENLNDDITLAGSFCVGKCNRMGVTVQVDDEIVTGVTKENFNDFWENHIAKVLKNEG